ncbi:hypothetical protein FKM82_014077 [Ascaphus truei]
MCFVPLLKETTRLLLCHSLVNNSPPGHPALRGTDSMSHNSPPCIGRERLYVPKFPSVSVTLQGKDVLCVL